MILTDNEIKAQDFIRGALDVGRRPTTYDATVGAIIRRGREDAANEFILKPRELVWVVSRETFAVPQSVTGLATLRTTWTHDGILVLNVGVVDPGWDGPLAAALVNLSGTDFVVRKGQPFFRVLFFGHDDVVCKKISKSENEYKKFVCDKSARFADTFLDVKTLKDEIERDVFRLPKWALYATFGAILISILALFSSMAFSVWSEYYKEVVKHEVMSKQLDELKSEKASKRDIEAVEKKVEDAIRNFSVGPSRLTPTSPSP